jgi:RsiW-degrading membrane proteinase PrsW (M82 family)
LQLLIPGILGAAAAHMADSAYLGYFIGLSALKPRSRWPILDPGCFSEAALHALWNASGVASILFGALVGVLSYAFLVAAI